MAQVRLAHSGPSLVPVQLRPALLHGRSRCIAATASSTTIGGERYWLLWEVHGDRRREILAAMGGGRDRKREILAAMRGGRDRKQVILAVFGRERDGKRFSSV